MRGLGSLICPDPPAFKTHARDPRPLGYQRSLVAPAVAWRAGEPTQQHAAAEVGAKAATPSLAWPTERSARSRSALRPPPRKRAHSPGAVWRLCQPSRILPASLEWKITASNFAERSWCQHFN